MNIRRKNPAHVIALCTIAAVGMLIAFDKASACQLVRSPALKGSGQYSGCSAATASIVADFSVFFNRLDVARRNLKSFPSATHQRT